MSVRPGLLDSFRGASAPAWPFLQVATKFWGPATAVQVQVKR